MFSYLSGVYAAALTPINEDFKLALNDILPLLDFLAQRGCHGALLFGTTGEGPSFSAVERQVMLEEAVKIRSTYPDFKLLAGTGTPSLDGTIELTKKAFSLGMDGVVVLPPYYYRSASQEGMYVWYSQLIEAAVPENGALFGYHIPSMTGVQLTIELLGRLKESYPNRFAGVKDSSSDPEHARKLGMTFGKDLLILSGNDRLFTHALENSASGCITALANLRSPDLRLVWDFYQDGMEHKEAQSRLDVNRGILEQYLPAPPLIKVVISRRHNLPRWLPRPPLMPLDPEIEVQAVSKFAGAE